MNYETLEELKREHPYLFYIQEHWSEEQGQQTLSLRLRGIYSVGPDWKKPEFGWRIMGPTPVVPIRVEAAHRIEELEEKIKKLEHQLYLTEETLKDSGYSPGGA